MTLPELYNLTLLAEALKAGQSVRTSDINQVYQTIPGINQFHKKAKAGKIKDILGCFDEISEDTLQKYLVDKQLNAQRLANHLKYNGKEYLMDIHEQQLKKEQDVLKNNLVNNQSKIIQPEKPNGNE